MTNPSGMAPGSARSPRREWFPRWLLPVLFFVLSWVHFTRDNEFPHLYHTDEPGKVAQIANGQWNLRHPPLMLLTTKAANRVFGPASSPQAIAILGRGVSAAFAAGAVAGLVLLAQGAFGPLTGALAGLLTAASPQLFELAHYFKEDTALIFGFAFLWVAMAYAQRQPGTSAALLLGLAAAVATSAKYIGILTLAFAIAAEAFSRRNLQPRRGWRGQALLLGAFLVGVAALNIPLLLDSAQFSSSLQTEMRAVSQGEGGIAHTSPITTYLKSLLGFTGWPVLIAGTLSLALHGALPKIPTRLPRLVALFPLVYLAIIACSPKTSSRYLLPVTVSVTFFAAVLPATLAQLVAPYFHRWPSAARLAIPLLLGLGLLGSQIANLLPTMQGFHRDARRELIAFLNANLPKDAHLVVERRVDLDVDAGQQEKVHPFDIRSKECAADLGTVAELRLQGINYIVIHGPTRYKFTSKVHVPQADARADYERRRAFYEQLDRECRLVWKTRKSKVGYLSPDLRVYDMAQPPAPEAASKKAKP
jgi:hypothetical protein